MPGKKPQGYKKPTTQMNQRNKRAMPPTANPMALARNKGQQGAAKRRRPTGY